MDLILWRHAEAEDISEDGGDLSRQLTPKGKQQAAAMARWLKKHGPQEPHILVSPALRTQETAQALAKRFETCSEIAPDASVNALLKACHWPGERHDPREAVILIGHQPTLGRLAARLLTGKEANWSVKKGAIWWIQRRARNDSEETIIKLVLPAELA
jgi:phosphohistidine phosphatase